MRTVVRRLVNAVVVLALGVVVAIWFRSRNHDETAGKAEWPPLRAVGEPDPPVHEPSDGSAAPPPAGDWVAPEADGGCPLSHPVKVKLRSGIYHVPGGLVYDRTNADRCYLDAASAEADGYRASRA